jgi:hypothetical protein
LNIKTPVLSHHQQISFGAAPFQHSVSNNQAAENMTNVKIVCKIGPTTEIRKMPQSARATKPFTLQNSAVNKKSSKGMSRITAAHSSVNSRVNAISAYSRSNTNNDGGQIQLRSRSIQQNEVVGSPKSRN